MTPRRSTCRRSAAAAVATITLLLAASCSDGRQSPVTQPAGPARKQAVFVVIGGRESSGAALGDSLHDAWPQQVFSSRFPAGTVYVNLAHDDATVEDAVRSQLPLALGQRPTVAIVWLGVADAAAGTKPPRFGRDLRVLLDRLRRGSTTRVLVAAPPVGVEAARYAAVEVDAARAAGADLVRLSATAWNPQAGGAEQVAVQSAAATELGQAVKG